MIDAKDNHPLFDSEPLIDRSPRRKSIVEINEQYSDEESRMTDLGLRSKEQDAAAVLEQLTLKEKISLCCGKDLWHLKGINRLNIPAVVLTDGPHGVIKRDSRGLLKGRVKATSFPTASALASGWDLDLVKRVGVALGKECVAEDVAVLLGPGMNIKRHPCCGRNFEYFSEDPYLTGKLGAALIAGIQSEGVGACIKHICVNNQENDRLRLDTLVDERTLREIYLRGFEMAIRESQPWTIMCAYNKLNGVYCSEHDRLWDGILRKEWGFEGVVMTDWGATNDRVKGIVSGVDLEMPGSFGVHDAEIKDAIEKGDALTMEQLDRSVHRNLSLSLLGMDAQDRQIQVDLEAHHALSRKVAMECSVLLKNEDNMLPLAKNDSIAVIGEFAKHPRYQGMGSSQVLPTQLDFAWDRLKEHTDTLSYAPGYRHGENGAQVDRFLIEEAVKAASHAKVAIIFCGLPGICESEGFDRPNIDMPPQHNALIKAVCAVNQNTVVVLSNGPPLAMPWASSPKAILECYLAGQAGGSASADLLFGVASPCGKLAETFPIYMEDVFADKWFPGELQVQYREGLNVGYRYFDTSKTPVLFPFGHGLSYTTFQYTRIRVAKPTDEDVNVEFDVTNTGKIPAAEIVQCYVHACESTVYRPEQELKEFTKIYLQPGEKKTITFHLRKAAFDFYDTGAKDWVVEPGKYEIRVGSSSRDIRLRGSVEIKQGHMPSEQVRTEHPTGTLAWERVDDDTFRRMFGREVPEVIDIDVFHRNSVVGELNRSWVGSILAFFVYSEARKAADGANDDAHRKMIDAMTSAVALRSLVLFSEGILTYTGLDMFIALINHQYPLLLWLIYLWILNLFNPVLKFFKFN